MSKKIVVGIIIAALIIVIFVDFRINGVNVFNDFARQLETDSLRKLQNGQIDIEYNADFADIQVENREIAIDEEIERIYIRNPYGNIAITGEDREDIILSYRITVYAEEEEAAKSLVEKLEIKYVKQGDRISFDMAAIEVPEDIYGIKRDYNLIVPAKLYLEINNKNGNMEISEIDSDVLLTNFQGEMDDTIVKDINGSVDLSTRRGRTNVTNVGELNMDSAYNKVNIRNVNGKLNLDQAYGQAIISSVNGDAEINASYGAIELEEIKGDLELEARYTQTEGEEVAGKFSGRISYGHLDLSEVRNNVDVNARYSGVDVDLSEGLTDYLIYCEADNGSLSTNLDFTVEKEDNRSIMEGSTGTGNIKVNLISDYGDITVYQ